MWFATLSLSLLGLLFAGPFGAILGAIIGLIIDSQKKPRSFIYSRMRTPPFQSSQKKGARSAFFKATFVTMGRVAKADGQVTRDEIQLATTLMGEMRLSPKMRQQAIDYFNQGKDQKIDMASVLREFRSASGSSSLIQMFIELQLQAAYADGVISQAELEVLYEVCAQLQVSQFSFRMLLTRFEAQQAFFRNYTQSSGGRNQGYSYSQSASELDNAYTILGVESTSDQNTVKRAYRKLMSQHHPDKLVAKGLPEEMMEVAKQKTQEIQAAYDLICKHRKG